MLDAVSTHRKSHAHVSSLIFHARVSVLHFSPIDCLLMSTPSISGLIQGPQDFPHHICSGFSFYVGSGPIMFVFLPHVGSPSLGQLKL